MADSAPLDTPSAGITEDGFLTDCWYLGVPSAELKPGTQMRRMMLGEPVLIGRTPAGEAFAFRDVCPHRLVPLSAGRQVETEGEPTVQCPYHGWRFGTDGVCRLLPSLTGSEPYEAARIKVRSYPVHEANGLVFVYIAHEARGAAEPCVPPPDFGPLPDAPLFTVAHLFDAHVDDAVMGLVDPAHVAFVHPAWWWRPPSQGLKLKEKAFEPCERGWVMSRHKPSSNFAYRHLFGGEVTSEIVFQLPGFRWEIIESEKVRAVTLTCPTPEGPNATRMTQVTWWTGGPLMRLAKPVLKRIASRFLGQDRDVLNLQNQGKPYGSSMMWIDDIDTQSKWYRTAKKNWATARTEGRDFENPVQAPVTLRWRS